MRISNASARDATSLPMRPSPTSPSVLPRTSAPDDDFSQRPSRIAASNFGSSRTSASNSANVCSATLTELPPGVLITRTPRFVASSKSMLSTPTPARPTARNFLAWSSNSAVTFVALRTIRASASAISACSVSFFVSTMLQSGCSFSNCAPRSLILSATITFMRLRCVLRVFPAPYKQSKVASPSSAVKYGRRHRAAAQARHSCLSTFMVCYIQGSEELKMSFAEKIQKDLVDAMRAKDELRLSVLRGIKAAIKHKEVEKIRTLDEAESIQILQTLVKQRKESIEQFTKGNRPELAGKETKELAIIESYLPAGASGAEMDAAITKAISESGATSIKQMGAVVKAAKAALEGKTVDGKALSDRVRDRLSKLG